MSTTTSDRTLAPKNDVAASPVTYKLPDEPLTKIKGGRSWSFFDFKELWSYRELLYFLTWRDLKVRYKQTILGVGWVVAQPLMMTLIFTVFLGLLARVPTGGVPYPLIAYSGLLPWMFVAGGISGCSVSLLANSNLITKVYFPRVLIPTAYIITRLLDFAISFLLFGGLLAIYRYGLHYPLTLSRSFLTLPMLMVLMTMFTLSLGILLSCMNVKYRDLSIGLPLFIQLWMFVSPVIYPAWVVPEKWRTLYFLNPLAGIIEGFRSALLGQPLNMFGLAVSTVATIVLFFFSALIFRRIEKSFADVI